MSSKWPEFESWRAEERKNRETDRLDVDRWNSEHPDDPEFYEMPPQAITPLVMKPIGPEVCGGCLATKDEPAGNCTYRFHTEEPNE